MRRITTTSVLLLCTLATAGICQADFYAVQSEPQTTFDPMHPYDGSKWSINGNGSVAWLDDSWLVVQTTNAPGDVLWLEARFNGVPPELAELPFIPCIVTGSLIESAATRTDEMIRWEWVLGAATAWPSPEPGDDPDVLSLPVADFNLDIGFVDFDYNTYPVATFEFDGIDIDELRIGSGGPSVIPAPSAVLLCIIGLGFCAARRRLFGRT